MLSRSETELSLFSPILCHISCLYSALEGVRSKVQLRFETIYDYTPEAICGSRPLSRPVLFLVDHSSTRSIKQGNSLLSRY